MAGQSAETPYDADAITRRVRGAMPDHLARSAQRPTIPDSMTRHTTQQQLRPLDSQPGPGEVRQ
ncbi:hypothetical protein [Streptomyces sp. B1-3]|uniref:hypothetical protein n=1 Tax=Streptomyces sp. B1-3 TaxID=3141453 RepID=UPI003D265934